MNKLVGSVVGSPVPQLEGQEKVSGSAQYIADLYRPNMLHGAVHQSPHAHARILGYDHCRVLLSLTPNLHSCTRAILL